MNVCNFIGRIGRDAETRSTPKGKQVTSWTVAVDVGYGENKSTLWVDCAMWDERGAKLAGYIKKGENIGVSGEISLRTWDKDGKSGAAVVLRVNGVKLLGGKPEADKAPSKPKAKAEEAPRMNDPDDDIPF